MHAVMNYPGGLYLLLARVFESLGMWPPIIWRSLAVLFLSVLTYLASVQYFRKDEIGLRPAANPQMSPVFSNLILSPIVFILVFSFAILVLRVPSFLMPPINQDESQWITAAATLFDDPRYWISVDGSSGGFLNSYPLLVIPALKLSLNYASVRLFGVIALIIPSLVLLYLSFRNIFGDKIARIAVLPVVLCLALVGDFDFVSYNSEHIYILLAAISIYALSRIFCLRRWNYLNIVFLGIILGLFPYAKLQVAPIGLAIALFCFGDIMIENKKHLNRMWPKLLTFMLAGLTPTFIVLGYAAYNHILRDFWQSYAMFNFLYASNGLLSEIDKIGWVEKFNLLGVFSFILIETRLYFAALVIVCLLAAVKAKSFFIFLLIAQKKFIAIALITMIVACYAVMQSGSFFLHYQLILIFHIGLLAGALAASFFYAAENNNKLSSARVTEYVILFLLISCIIPSAAPIANGTHNFEYYKEAAMDDTHNSVISVIREYSMPGEKMSVWGWMNEYHIYCSLLQGTRSINVYNEVFESPQHKYYIERYAKDLLINKPVIFLDVVTPHSFCVRDAAYKHENFSEIKDIIGSNYIQVADIDGNRIYVRKDRYAAAGKG